MRPNKIINHHSLTKDGVTVSSGAMRKWHMGLIGQPDKTKPNYNYYVDHPSVDIGYNAIIELVGDHYEVLLGRMFNEVGAHTRGHNHDSIGVCWVGDYDRNEVPPDMWRLGVRFESSLIDLMDIDVNEIYGHHDFANYKSCPGNNFNIGMFRENVREYINEGVKL